MEPEGAGGGEGTGERQEAWGAKGAEEAGERGASVCVGIQSWYSETKKKPYLELLIFVGDKMGFVGYDFSRRVRHSRQ